MRGRFKSFLLVFACLTFLLFLFSSEATSQDIRSYKYDINQIFKRAKSRIAEIEKKTEFEKKFKQLEELDREAESLMAKGKYKKAKKVYEKILKLSKDPILKEYAKEANIAAKKEEAEKLRQ